MIQAKFKVKDSVMKKFVVALCGLCAAAFATPCEDVMENIAAKIGFNGVEIFTLEVVEMGTQTDGKVVGVCGGGTHEIVYVRGPSTRDTQVEYTAPASEF